MISWILLFALHDEIKLTKNISGEANVHLEKNLLKII